jgi:hypothetical protein
MLGDALRDLLDPRLKGGQAATPAPALPGAFSSGSHQVFIRLPYDVSRSLDRP